METIQCWWLEAKGWRPAKGLEAYNGNKWVSPDGWLYTHSAAVDAQMQAEIRAAGKDPVALLEALEK